jgi:hypothetical protein
VVDFAVELRRGDGEREGKIWGENGFGTKNEYRRRRRWFQNQIFFLKKKNAKTEMALST